MTIRSLLLASTVLPFALSYPALAAEKSLAPMVLAQTEPACPEGEECPPASETAPATEAAPAEEPATEAPTAEEPAAETPAATDAPAAEEQAPAATQEAPAEQPAAETTEEPAAGQGNRRQRALERARRQQEQLQQGAEQPAAEPAPATQDEAPAAQEPTAAEQPATEEPAAQQPAAEQPATTVQPAPAEQPAAAGQQQPATGTEPAQAPAAEPAAEGESTVEQQLEAQGDTQQAQQIRELRRKLREERAKADAQAPAAEAGAEPAPAAGADGNERADRRRERREQRRENVVEERGDRIIIDLGGGNLVIERAGPDEGERLLYGARDVQVEQLPGGETRTIVFRENGSQIITVRNAYGDIITRTRVTPNGREVVLIDNRIPVVVEGGPQVAFQPVELPPLQLTIPREQYVVDLGQADEQQIQQVLLAPPVEAVERPYTLEEVTRNERVRDKMSRIDLDTITFAFGSATIGTDQMQSLNALGTSLEQVLAENPEEVYLIEGHTDAVGSDYDNLILSDQRAEAVAVALSQNFDVPPENLVTEGYGEQYLKVETEAEERANRRVTVRRITPLLAAEAQ